MSLIIRGCHSYTFIRITTRRRVRNSEKAIFNFYLRAIFLYFANLFLELEKAAVSFFENLARSDNMGFSHNLEDVEVFVSSSLIKPLGAFGHTSGRQTCPQVHTTR